jgi:predicted LPLAT superfamily acyltransferase
MDPATSSFILGRTALHLREGGLLFAAPDVPSGARNIVLERLGRPWSFSLGVPVLARRLKVPVFLLLALWRDSRIRLEIQQFEPPSPDLPEEQWLQVWIES